MIEVQHLTKKYDGRAVVDDISFEVHKGETMVLLGRSGCGKTTTLKMINRLIEPDGGQIRIDSKDVMTQDPVQLRRSIGYVIQENGLFPHYTVRENIGIVPKLLDYDEQNETEAIVDDLLSVLGLEPGSYKSKYPHELSGGQRQRVAIARAVAVRPSLLLMDEPFSALDPLTRVMVRNRFKELSEYIVATTILVTHDIAEAIDIADKICVMDDGKIMQKGPPAELVFHPANDFIREFFDENRFESELRVLTWANVAPYLPEKQDLPFSANDNLMAVVEQLTKKPGILLTKSELLAAADRYCGR